MHADHVPRKTMLAATAPRQALPDRWPGLHHRADQGPAQAGVQEQTIADNGVMTAKIHPQRQTKALKTLCGYVEINTNDTFGPTWRQYWTRSPCLPEPVRRTPAEPGARSRALQSGPPVATAPSWAAPGCWPQRAGCFWAPAVQSSNPPDGAAAESSCGSSRG